MILTHQTRVANDLYRRLGSVPPQDTYEVIGGSLILVNGSIEERRPCVLLPGDQLIVAKIGGQGYVLFHKGCSIGAHVSDHWPPNEPSVVRWLSPLAVLGRALDQQ